MNFVPPSERPSSVETEMRHCSSDPARARSDQFSQPPPGVVLKSVENAQTNVEVSLKGKIRQVSALDVGGRSVIVDGRFFRLARIHQESWFADDFEDLPSFLEQLRCTSVRLGRIDAFTFAQNLPHLSQKHDFKTHAESVAAIPITTYEHWMDGLQRDSRTDVRKAAKRGVAVRASELTDEFVRGIVALYNESPVRQGKRFWHYGKQEGAVRKENSSFTDRSVFLGAYVGGDLVGFMKIVEVGRIGAMMQDSRG